MTAAIAPATPIREVLVVDTDDGVRAQLADVLGAAGFEVVEASDGTEAIAAVRSQARRFDAVLLEVDLPGLCGYEICHALRDQFGDSLPIVLLSGTRTEHYDCVAGLLVGADDYVTKPFATDELLARLRRLTHRAARTAARSRADTLTNRELEILGLLADGLDQEQIAARLFISVRTVGTHIEHILSKLRVRNRTQAVAVAYRDELVAQAGRH